MSAGHLAADGAPSADPADPAPAVPPAPALDTAVETPGPFARDPGISRSRIPGSDDGPPRRFGQKSTPPPMPCGVRAPLAKRVGLAAVKASRRVAATARGTLPSNRRLCVSRGKRIRRRGEHRPMRPVGRGRSRRAPTRPDRRSGWQRCEGPRGVCLPEPTPTVFLGTSRPAQRKNTTCIAIFPQAALRTRGHGPANGRTRTRLDVQGRRPATWRGSPGDRGHAVSRPGRRPTNRPPHGSARPFWARRGMFLRLRDAVKPGIWQTVYQSVGPRRPNPAWYGVL